MVAYMIVDIDIHEPAAFEPYRNGVGALIAKHGGEYLVRGGEFEVIEGDWKPRRLAMMRFPNRAAIRAFFADPEYAELKALRKRTANSAIVAVDGVA
jgi:uncharacterized protein (DUF1330 family)